MIVFEKTYDGESIVDADRDFSEALQAEYNSAMDKIPQDEYGFAQGRFTVKIEWSNHE
jgi:hypothetical protein